MDGESKVLAARSIDGCQKSRDLIQLAGTATCSSHMVARPNIFRPGCQGKIRRRRFRVSKRTSISRFLTYAFINNNPPAHPQPRTTSCSASSLPLTSSLSHRDFWAVIRTFLYIYSIATPTRLSTPLSRPHIRASCFGTHTIISRKVLRHSFPVSC